MTHYLLHAALPALLLALAAPAVAQPAPKLATKEEYRSCRQTQATLAQRLQRLQAGLQLHQADTAQMERERAALDEAWRRPGLRTPTELNTYNRAMDALDLRTKALNNSGATLQREQQAYNAAVQEVNGRCAGITVDAADAAEVDREFPPPPQPQPGS